MEPADPGADAPPVGRRGLGLLLISAATILLQLSLTRVLAVMLWYHFGFVVISAAMLGLGGAALLLACAPRLRTVVDLDGALARLSLALAAAIAGGYVALLWIPLAPFRLLLDPWQWLWGALAIALVGLPFALSGLVVGLVLARAGAATHRLYAADLIGAGLGAAAVIEVMPALGGSGSVIACGALAAIASVAFAGASRRRLQLLGLAAGLALALEAGFAERTMPIDTTVNKGAPPRGTHLATRWNAGSRIDVYEAKGAHGRRIFEVDGGVAATANFDLRPDVRTALAARRGLPTWARLALVGRDPGDVLVLGAGAGIDVLAAVHAGARSVTAVEVNPILTEAVQGSMAEYFGRLFELPEVRLITEDARAFLRRDRGRYDVILAVHTVSNAALAAGALALTEDALFTREALDDWLDHLAEGGTILITRPATHLPRLCVTLREAWERRGWGDLRGRVLVFHGGNRGFSSGLLVSRDALSADRRAAIAERLPKLRATIVYPAGEGGAPLSSAREDAPSTREDAPSTRDDAPSSSASKDAPSSSASDDAPPRSASKDAPTSSAPDDAPMIYAALLVGPDLAGVVASSAELLDPATDDRPFAGHRLRWLDLRGRHLAALLTADDTGRLAIEDQPIAEVTLLALLLGLAGTIAALLALARRRLRGSGLSGRATAFYALLGLAFMITEVALLHRAALLVGQPVIAFSLVLGVMLIFAGLGAALARRIDRRASALRGIVAALPALLLITAWGQATLAPSILALEFHARVLVVGATIAPLALALGIPLALALRRLAEAAPERVPLAWAINSFAAVLGSVLAVMIAMSTGLASALVVAGLVYLVAAALAPAVAPPPR
ncbi:MAG: hypothetical protein R3B09_19260 [Nannocystaceae bacterium]